MGNSWARYKNRKVVSELETRSQSQSRPAVLPAHTQLPTQEATLKGLYEAIALSILRQRDTTGADKKTQVERLSALLKATQVVLSTLKDAPLGIGTGEDYYCSCASCCSVMSRGQRPSSRLRRNVNPGERHVRGKGEIMKS